MCPKEKVCKEVADEGQQKESVVVGRNGVDSSVANYLGRDYHPYRYIQRTS